MNKLELLQKITELEAKLAEMERCAENNKKVALLVSAEHNAKIEKLEQQLAEKEFYKLKSQTPKFKQNSYVYAFFTQTEIYKGQIDAFDYYTNSYLIFPNEDIGNEWVPAHLVFKTKEEAQAKLEELQGETIKEIDNQIKQLKEGK